MIFGEISPQAQILLFLFFALTIAILLKQLQNRYKSISYTPTLFIVSVLIGYFSEDFGVVGEAISSVSQIDPRGILILFLPPLIFQSAFNSDWHIFRKQSVQIFILAFPAVLLSALFIMVSIKSIIGYDDSFYNWTQAFMFGSVLSCTDTVAVLALLKQAGAPKKFNSLIEGQSLFNDGSCMVLLTISFSLIKGQSPHPASIGLLFLQLTLGGIILGVIFGILASALIKMVRNDSVLVLNITLASCYIVYFVAQYVDLGIRVSGIMSLVSLGLYMAAFGKTKIPYQPRQKIQNFWKVVIYVAESIIFIIGGLLVGSRVLGSHQIKIIGLPQFQKLGALYFCMMGARFFSISIFMPKLKNQGYGLKWNEVCVLTYGGLRGAVGVAFTLIIASDPTLNQKFTFICLFNMAGCSILTLVINASTANYVIRKVGLCVKSQTKTRLFIKFMLECLKDLYSKINQLKKNKYLTNSDWQKVQLQSGVLTLKESIHKIQGGIRITTQQLRNTAIKQKSLNANLLEDHIGAIDENLMMEIRNRFCIILKGILWGKFQDNQCSIQTIRVLIQCVDWDLDTLERPLNSWDFILSHIHNPKIFVFSFWCKQYPIIRNFADSIIFQRAGFIYDIVSTYIQALHDCENKSKQLPFDSRSLDKLIEESTHNRQFAEKYLKQQIIISYPQIMKKIQTNKAAQSILTFQKNHIKKAFKFGQLEDYFYRKLLEMVQKNSIMVENDWKKEIMKDNEILLSNQFFKHLSEKEIHYLLDKKIQITKQKDQAIIKTYENTKYLYLITRGQVNEQIKHENKTISKTSRKIYQFVGLNSLLLKRYKKLEDSANANSIVCLFAFPIQDIQKIILNSPKLEGILQKELILFYAKYYANFPDFKIDKQQQKFKECLEYIYIPSGEQMMLDRCRIFLIEGQLVSQTENFSAGYYEIKQTEKWSVKGAAKLFIIQDNFFALGKMSVMIRKSEDIKRKTYDDKLNGVIDRALYT